MKFVVAVAILFASQGVAATTVQQRSNVVNLLAARQAPSAPSVPGGLGDCNGLCVDWENMADPCYNLTQSATDLSAVTACLCTDQMVDAWAACDNCLIPLVAAQGGDPNFATEEQGDLTDFVSSCAEAGHKVKSVTLSGSSGGSSPSTPGGSAPSPSASGSSGSGGSGSGSGSGGSGGKGNGASSNGPAAAALALGALGIFAGFL